MNEKEKKSATTALRVNGIAVNEESLQEEWQLVQKKTSNAQFLNTISIEEKQKFFQTTLLYAKENIINRILIEQAATALTEEIPFKQVTEEYEKMIQHFGGEENFKKKFSSSNKIPSRFTILEKIELSIKIDNLLKKWKKDVPEESETVIRKFYEENVSLYDAKERVLLSYVYIPAKLPECPQDVMKALQTDISVDIAHAKLQTIFSNNPKNFKNAELKKNVLVEKGSDFSLPNFPNKTFFTSYANDVSGLLIAQESYLWFRVLLKMAPGTWEYEHIKKRVRDDWVALQQKNSINKNTTILRKKASVDDFFQLQQ